MSPHQKSRCPAGHRAVVMLGSKITDLMFYFILIRSLRQQGELSSVQYQLPTFKLNNSFNGQSKETKVVKLISSLFFDKVKLKFTEIIFLYFPSLQIVPVNYSTSSMFLIPHCKRLTYKI